MVTGKRKRATKVCDFCKRRKVKCDRGSPCSSCVKYNNHNCHYEEVTICPGVSKPDVVSESDYMSTVVADDKIKTEIKLLKEKLKNLEESVVPNEDSLAENNLNLSESDESLLSIPDFAMGRSLESLFGNNPYYSASDEINFSEGYTPIYDKGRYYGPLSFYALLKLDPTLIRLHDTIKKNKSRIFKKASQQEDSAKEELFRAKLTDMEGENLMKPFVSNGRNSSELGKLNTRTADLHTNCMTSGLTFYEGDINEELEILKKIELILPNKKVIWKLFRRFFACIYQFVPIFDEFSFQEQIESLIGEESEKEEKIIDLKVQKKLDLLILGQLLVVLRFAYLSLFTNIISVNVANFQSNDPSPLAQEIRFLLSNPVNIETISLAHECLNQFNLFGSINLSMFQLAIAIKYYHQYAPEDGDGAESGEAQAFTSLLISMSHSLGLHRDPDNFPEEFVDQRMNNLCRKLWFSLIITDAESSLFSGLPMNIRHDRYDTKAPFYEPGNENVRDLSIEERVCACFENTEVIFESLTEMFNMISKIRGTQKVSDVVKKLNSLETSLIGAHGHQIWHYLNYKDLSSEQIFFKIVKIKIYFKLNNYIMAICFHLFNYYESRRNPAYAFFYLKKMLAISVYELLPFYYQLLNQSDIMLKGGTDLFITPGFESAIHKSLVVLFAIFLRVKSSILSIENNYDVNNLQSYECSIRDRYKKLVYFGILIQECIDYFVKAISKLSHRYFYAWKVTKIQNMILRILKEKSFFSRNSLQLETNGFKFSNDMIQDLIGLIRKSLKRVKYYSSNKDPGNSFQNIDVDDFDSEEVGSSASYEASTKNTSTDIGNNDYIPDDQIDTLWFKMISMKRQDAATSSKFDFFSNSLPNNSGLSNYSLESNWMGSFNEKNAALNENIDFSEDQFVVDNIDSIAMDELLRDLV